MSFLRRRLNEVYHAWDRFWFAPMDLYALSMFRLVFGINYFLFYFSRLLDYEFLFTDSGFLPYQEWLTIAPHHSQSLIPWGTLSANESFGFVLHIVLLVGAFALAAGWTSRRFTWVVFLLHLVFLHRNPLVVHGPDLVSTFWLFFLSISNCNRYLRVPWPFMRKEDQGSELSTSDLVSSVAIRLMQLELCIIYAYGGIEKARGVTWWRGDALWNALGHGHLVSIDFGFLYHVPWLLAAVTFTVLVWEIYFPFLIWIKSLRFYTLTFGFLLHLSVGILLGIPYFSIFMISSYLLFIDPRVLRRFVSRLASVHQGKATDANET